MKTTLAIVLVLSGALTLAALQDEPLQVWLLIFAPVILVAIALVLHISDTSRYD